MFGRSNTSRYRDRTDGIRSLLRTDSMLVRILVFLAMSVLFFLFLKVTERKIPSGIAPDTTYQRSVDTAGHVPQGAVQP